MNKFAYFKMMGLDKFATEETGDLGALQHKKHLSQFGAGTAKALFTTLLGALLGRGVPGAAVGWLANRGAYLGGALAGSLKGPLSMKEYKEYLKSRPISDYFIPGSTGYNAAREASTLEALNRNKVYQMIQGLSNK